MTLARHAKRRDANEPAIVAALETIGVRVWRLDRPCDLLTLYRGIWRPLEVKDPDAYTDKRQKAQIEFLQSTGTLIVRTPLQALQAVGAFRA
jgi:hypothetical protein